MVEDAVARIDFGPDAAPINCDPPRQLKLTVNRIPETLNGSFPFMNMSGRMEPYQLLLPRQGFTLDLIGAPQDIARLSLLKLGCGAVAAEARAEALAEGWSWRVDEDLPLGPVLCTAEVLPPCTQTPIQLRYEAEIGELTAALDPFDRVETWLILYHRDHWTLDVALDEAGSLRMGGSLAPNGIPDFEEAMRGVGLYSDDQGAGAAALEEDGARGASAIFQRRLMKETQIKLRGLFMQPPDGFLGPDSVPIHFVLEGEPGAPDPNDFTEAGALSLVGVGGGDPRDTVVGRATLDWQNQSAQDNANDPTRGIFTTTLVALFTRVSVAEGLLSAFAPALGGVPVGGHDADAQILMGDTSGDPQRAYVLNWLTDLLSRGLAALMAHEIAHSLGLVPYGPPPMGLFAGETRGAYAAGEFVGAHVNTEGFNVMQQAFALDDEGAGAILAAEPFFNALNLAYLQKRLIVDPEYPRADQDTPLAPKAAHHAWCDL